MALVVGQADVAQQGVLADHCQIEGDKEFEPQMRDLGRGKRWKFFSFIGVAVQAGKVYELKVKRSTILTVIFNLKPVIKF